MSSQRELLDGYLSSLEGLVSLPRRRRDLLLRSEQELAGSATRMEQDVRRARSDHGIEVDAVGRRLRSARAIVQSAGHPELIPTTIAPAMNPDPSMDVEMSFLALEQAASALQRIREACANETPPHPSNTRGLWSRVFASRAGVGPRAGLMALLSVVFGSGAVSAAINLTLGAGVHVLGILVGVVICFPFGEAVGDVILSSARWAGQERVRTSGLANYCMCTGVAAVAAGLGGIVSGFDESKAMIMIAPLAFGALAVSIGFENSGLEGISKENPRIVPPIMWDGAAGVAVSTLSLLLVIALRETEGARIGHAVGLGLVVAAASIPTFGHLCRSVLRGLYRSLSKGPAVVRQGSVVWTRVDFEDEPNQGKDRPVVVVGSEGTALLVLALTTKEKRDRGDRVAIGSGPWDPLGRTSYVKLSRIIKVNRADIRRTGGHLDSKRLSVLMRHAAVHHPQLGAVAIVETRDLPKVVKSISYAASWAIIGLHVGGMVSPFG